VLDQDDDLWIWSLTRRTLTRLTFDPGPDRGPVWTPDGRRIVFSSSRGGRPNLFWQAADGTGTPERLTEGPYSQFASSISADGTRLVFDEFGQTGIDVRMVTLDGERRAVSLIATTFSEQSSDLSSDGRWMAYQSTESGRDEVYVRPFPNVDGGRWQLSSGGGTNPLWAHNSRELFYVDPEGRIVAVPIQLDSGFSAGSPRVIVDRPFAAALRGFGARMYDVSPDGQRFLLVKPVDGAQQKAPPPQIIVIQDWHEELKRLVPR